jgi:hypothetical protein
VEKMGVESGSVRRMARPADRARPVPKSMIFLANWLSSKVSAVGPFQCVQRVLEHLFSAPRLGNFALLRGKRPGGEPGLDRGREPRDVYQIVRAFARGIVIIPLPRPAFVGGKGSPCEKKKGSLCEEEK